MEAHAAEDEHEQIVGRPAAAAGVEGELLVAVIYEGVGLVMVCI